MPKDGWATRKLNSKVKAVEPGGIRTSRISYGWDPMVGRSVSASPECAEMPRSAIGIEHPRRILEALHYDDG